MSGIGFSGVLEINKQARLNDKAIKNLESWYNPVRVWNGCIPYLDDDGIKHYQTHWSCRIDGSPYPITGRGMTIAEAVQNCETKIVQAKEVSRGT